MLRHSATHCKMLQHSATLLSAGYDPWMWAISSCNNHYDTLQHTLQYTAPLCNARQQTATHATHCNTLQHTATHCNTLQHTAAHCNTLQHTATHCNTLQHTATHCSTLRHAATHFCSMIPGCGGLFCFIFNPERTNSVAGCCRVLQCVAECCTVCTECYRALSPILHFFLFFILNIPTPCPLFRSKQPCFGSVSVGFFRTNEPCFGSILLLLFCTENPCFCSLLSAQKCPFW